MEVCVCVCFLLANEYTKMLFKYLQTTPTKYVHIKAMNLDDQ